MAASSRTRWLTCHGIAQLLQELDGVEEHEADDRQRENGREHQRRLEVRVGDEQQVAEPLVGADELADDRAGDRERRRDLQAAEEVRQAGRQAKPQEDLHPRRAHRARQVVHLGRHRPQADRRVDHDREERDQERDQHLGQDADTEPHQEERRDRDLRHHLEEQHRRHYEAVEPLRRGDRDRERDRDADCEAVADEHLVGRDPAVVHELRQLVEEGAEDRRRRRQQVSRRLEDRNAHLPDHEEDEDPGERDELPDDGGEEVAVLAGRCVGCDTRHRVSSLSFPPRSAARSPPARRWRRRAPVRRGP